MKTSPLISLLRRPHNKAWVIIALILVWVPGLHAEDAYKIRLARHKSRVGLEFQLRAELHQTEGSSFKSESRSQQTNTTSSIELLAHGKVLTNAESSESLELVIQRLIERQATNCNALLEPGTVVITKTVAGERFFTADRGQVSLAVTKVLVRLLGSVSDETGCTPDQALGTAEPKKIGDTWKGNPDCVIRGLNKYFGIVEPNQFEVTMKLLGVEEVNGTKCLRSGLSMLIHTDKPIARIAKDPRSRRFNAQWDTEFHYEGVRLLPVDEDLPCLRMEEKGEAVSKVEYTTGKRFVVWELSSAEQKTAEIELLN